MNATLNFNLPIELEEFQDACQGTAYKATLHDLDNWLRNKQKYESITVLDVAEVQQQLTACAIENGVELWP